MYTRRGFGRLALAGLPLSLALAKINSKIDGVQLGVQTYSFRDLPLAEAIQAIAADGLGACELYSPHIEGGHTDRAPAAGMRAPATGASGAGQGGPGGSQGDPAARAAAR